MIKTFRGLIADGAQDKISLRTNRGGVGYRIVKFQMIGINPATSGQESTIKVFKVKQTSVTGAIDFSDNKLLAAGFLSGHDQTPSYPEDVAVIFDQEVFNQDIYVTHFEANAAVGCNYYLELEVINLNENESTMATLKDIRNTKTQGF